MILQIVLKFCHVLREKTLKRVNKNVNFTIVPGPTFGSSQKLGFAVLPMVVYNINKSDSISPPSSTAVLFYFDFYGSWVAALKQSIYWNQNKWRAFITIGYGDLQLKFYGIGQDKAIIPNNDSNYVWSQQKEMDVVVTCFRKIYKGVYGGLEFRYTQSNLQGSDLYPPPLTISSPPISSLTASTNDSTSGLFLK